ncbi:MAG: septal ring lytic transglycosylase RlpA family protein [Candidatus Handelsmanbacteria bacterium]|nr:septal ring lytic transglycosylase RlpA family protein [Candidatus Handelsmanbacteria bacterium]
MGRILSWCGALGLMAGCAPHPLYRAAPPLPPPAEVVAPPARPWVPVSKEEAAQLEVVADSGHFSAAEIPPPAYEVADLKKISTKNAYQVGQASYYGKGFHGRRTAKGDTFDIRLMTAAHRVLPLGTFIKVTNLENGRTVELEVNDRGPFSRRRVLDVSLEAARRLDMVRKGSAKVMIEIVKSVKE